MKIRRKEIIREIICEEAKSRGFEVIWGTKTGSTWNIALFSRDGYGQRFDIVEDSYQKETIVLYFSTKVISYKYNSDDEMSYRDAVRKMEEFLEKEGYSILDELRKHHTVQKEDRDYVFENMKELSKQYSDELNIGDATLTEVIKYVSKSLFEMEGQEWEVIKEDFYKVCGFYIDNLLKIPSLEVFRKKIEITSNNSDQKDNGQLLTIRRKDDEYCKIYPIECLLGSFYSESSVEDIEKDYESELNSLLTVQELQELGIRIEPWKTYKPEPVYDEYGNEL